MSEELDFYPLLVLLFTNLNYICEAKIKNLDFWRL